MGEGCSGHGPAALGHIMKKRLFAKDLYDYLLRLACVLRQRGETGLSEQVEFASRFAVGSTTELFTEAEIALKAVLARQSGVLLEEELADLSETLRGIDAEFRMIGGA